MSLRDDLSELQQDTTNLILYAEQQSDVSTDLMRSLESLRDEIGEQISASSSLTVEEIQRLRYQLQDLHSQVARAIAVSSVVIRNAIRSGASEVGNKAIVSGLIAGGMAAAAIGLAAYFTSRPKKEVDRKRSEIELREDSLILLADRLEKSKPFVTFRYLVDSACDSVRGVMSRQEAQALLPVLIADGHFEAYQYGDRRAIRLKRSSDKVARALGAASSALPPATEA